MADVAVSIHRYAYTGGEVTHFHRQGRQSSVENALISAAGPGANILCVVLAVAAVYLAPTAWQHGWPIAIPHFVGTHIVIEHETSVTITAWAIIVALLGFAFGNGFVAAYNLWPHPGNDKGSIPSDGWRLLNNWRPTSQMDAPFLQFLRVERFMRLRRYEEAITAASVGLAASRIKLHYADIIVRQMALSRGDRAAIDYYRDNIQLFYAPDLANQKVNLANVEASVAWSALKSGDEDAQSLAEQSITVAYGANPFSPRISGGYGAWLVTVNRAAEGMPFLVDAALRTEPTPEKADLADFLARGARQLGDDRLAVLYNGVALHLRKSRH
jgi:hypothetical protein